MIVVLVTEDAAGIALRVVVLVGLHRVDEEGKPGTSEQQRDGDKEDENVHGGYLSLSALSDTVIELADMAKAAISGVARPATASGTATIL